MFRWVWWVPVLVLSAGAVPQTAPTAPQTPAQSRDPVRWSASVAESQTRGARGRARVDVQLTAELDTGWHIYSLSPVPQGPAPTIVGLPAGQPFALAGDITEPLPQTKYDPNFDRDTSFFEDAVTFVLPVKVDAAARPGTQSASIVVSYQVCDSQNLFTARARHRFGAADDQGRVSARRHLETIHPHAAGHPGTSIEPCASIGDQI